VIDSSTINALAREKSIGRGRDWDSVQNAIADENVVPKHNRSISMERADESFMSSYNSNQGLFNVAKANHDSRGRFH